MFDDETEMDSYEAEEARYSPDLSDFEELHDRTEDLASDEYQEDLEVEVEAANRLIEANPDLLDDVDEDEDEFLKSLSDVTPESFRDSVDSSSEAESDSEELAPPAEGSVDGEGEGEVRWQETGDGEGEVLPVVAGTDLVADDEMAELKELAESGARFDDVDGVYMQTGQGATDEDVAGPEAERRREGAFQRVKLNDDALRFVRNEGLSAVEKDEVNALVHDIEQAAFERAEAAADEASDRNIKVSLAKGTGKGL